MREILEKSEEIKNGVTQLQRLAQRLNADPRSFFDTLSIDGTYQFGFVVLSDAFIGLASVQHPDIPVLQLAHFVRKVNSLGHLVDVLPWLSSKAYLPVEGRHYNAVEDTWKVGRWSLRWYGIKTLLQNEEYL